MVHIRKQLRPSCTTAVVAGSSAATAIDLDSEEERDWAQLLPELVRKISDDLLHEEATEYIRLRAVCHPWRSATDDPSALEPRFFPRNWLMLHAPRYKLRRDGMGERFVNVRNGAFLQIHLPTPREYSHHGNTEGLLILYHRATDTVCLLNPLTMAFTELPSLASIHHDHVTNCGRFPEHAIKAAGVLVEVDKQGKASEPPNVVLSLTSWTRTALVYARPREFVWRLVDTSCADELEGKLPTIKGGLSFWGKFYVPTRGGDVLRVVLEPRPYLTFIARQIGSSVCSGLSETSYLVMSGDNKKVGMLLVRKEIRGGRRTYLQWDVDLTNRRLIRVIALHDMTVMLPSITLRSSAFPTIVPNRVCYKEARRRLLRGYYLV